MLIHIAVYKRNNVEIDTLKKDTLLFESLKDPTTVLYLLNILLSTIIHLLHYYLYKLYNGLN